MQRTTFADLFQYVENFGTFLLIIRRCEHLREKAFGSLRRGVIVRFRPKDRAGVSDGQAVIIFAAQQIVQRSGVGKGGLFGHWGICALLLAERGKGFFVERDNRTAGALPTKHAFNRWMQPCNRGGIAANQAQALNRFVAFQAACPQGLRSFTLMDKCGRFFKRKCDVGIEHFGRQIFGSEIIRLPVLQKTAQGLQAFIFAVLQ